MPRHGETRGSSFSEQVYNEKTRRWCNKDGSEGKIIMESSEYKELQRQLSETNSYFEDSSEFPDKRFKITVKSSKSVHNGYCSDNDGSYEDREEYITFYRKIPMYR